MSLQDDIELLDGVVEGFDWLGTGSCGKTAQKDERDTVAAWKRLKKLLNQGGTMSC